MSSANYPLRQCGIYRNLPDFDPSIRGLTALICGASGISGFHAMRALLDAPERWKAIHMLSRSPLPEELARLLTDEQRSRVKHTKVDLTSSGELIARSLTDAGIDAVDHVFFYSYLDPPSGKSAISPETAHELVEANVPLLNNFLQSLEAAKLSPKSIMLQTGAKNYGMHIGRVRTPMVESDPQPEHLQPNFYYPQERLLFAFCERHPETSWNVVRPEAIIGANSTASMNFMYGFAVYAAVQAHRDEPLEFGGDFDAWEFEVDHSTARLTGYLAEWAALEDKCKNQSFNSIDGSPLSWDRFFGELARWYGVEAGVRPPKYPEDADGFTVFSSAGGDQAPLGYGPPLQARLSFSLSDWSKRQENVDVWKQLMEKHKGQLVKNPFDDPRRTQFDSDMCYMNYGSASMNKARRFGFTGFVDTLESTFEAYREMAEMGCLPPLVVDAARPLI